MDDSQELSLIVQHRLDDLVSLSWEELVALEGDADHEPFSLGGTSYVLESQVFWDDRRGGDLRVTVDVYRDGPTFTRSIVLMDRIRRRPGAER
jgi:hypothetical protein